MSSPLKQKVGEDFLSQMIEHVVSGIVTEQDEVHNNDSANKSYPEDDPATNTFVMRCGLPDIPNGELVTIDRVFGTRNDSFYEFSQNTDYTVDISNNSITFINPADTLTIIKITYRYDQKYSTPITNVGRGTVSDILLSAISKRMADISSTILLAKQAGYIDTAEGDDLVQLVKLINLERNPATKATGFVTVYRSGNSPNVVIPVGDKFGTDATERTEQVLYEVSVAGLFVDGFSSARVAIEASDGYEGKRGNIAPNRIINVISGSGITRVNNPIRYTSYEFISVIAGKYTYFLSNVPERTINSQAYPPAITDKGLYATCYWIDKAIDVTGAVWTLDLGTGGDVTVTEDDPETGVTKVVVDDLGTGNNPYISIVGQSIPRIDGDAYIQGYDHIFIYIRGETGKQFKLTVRDGIVSDSEPSLRKFNDGIAPAVTQTVENGFKLFHGPHGLGNTITEAQQTDGVATISTGNFSSVLASFSSGPAIDDLLIISAGADTGTYIITEITDDSNIVVTPGFTVGGSGQTFTVERQDPITEVRINFLTVGTYFIDWIAIGTFMEEVTSASLNLPDELVVSYTSSRLSINKNATLGDFFDTYDGDASDGHSDELMVFYEWRNNIAGGGDEETDELLRTRAKIAFASFGKGTKNAIRGALLDVDSIKEAVVQDFDDDPSIVPGNIIVSLLAEGYKLSAGLEAEAKSVIDSNRAAGIRSQIRLPEIRYVNFELNLVYDDSTGQYTGSAGLLALQNVISSVVDDYFTDKTSINLNLYFSDLIGFIIKEVDVVIGGYIAYERDIETGADGATTVSTGIFDSSGSTFVTNGVQANDILWITSGADIGYYIIQTVAQTQLTIYSNFTTTAGTLNFEVFRAPRTSDDDLDLIPYVFDPTNILEDPLRINGKKTGVSLVVQRGDFPLFNIKLIGKSSQ